jgi:hypothetical protein
MDAVAGVTAPLADSQGSKTELDGVCPHHQRDKQLKDTSVVATYVARKAPDASATGPLSFGVQMPAYGWNQHLNRH